jgi:hypothetical protein
MEIIQIVPALPPAVNGLGDHALLLAKELRDEYDINTTFIVTTPSAQFTDGGFTIEMLGARSEKELLKSLTAVATTSGIVLLHYVGYAYARRGCPFWLINGLRAWRANSSRRCLITVFHEIAATGPPWRSSFWTAAYQKAIAKQLVLISDRCRTTMEMYARRLARISGRKDFPAMPIFSNVGEGIDVKAFEHRKKTFVIFGGTACRAAVYTRHRAELVRAFHMLESDEVIDIGPPLGFKPSMPIPFRQTGVANSSEISAILSDARIGVLCYPAPFLAKSTIFAAYAAHGVAPLLLGVSGSNCEDGLTEGREYLTARMLPLDSHQLAAVSSAAYRWYANHDLAETAREYAETIRSGSVTRVL